METPVETHFKYFVTEVTNLQNSMECQKISLGQPSCTHRCSNSCSILLFLYTKDSTRLIILRSRGQGLNAMS